MATEDTLGARYDMRRRARGAEPPPERHTWKRRLLLGATAVLLVIALGVGVWVWWAFTHVRAARASLWAAVIPLRSRVDARLTELLVRPHDKVEAGQELARLDDPQVRAALEGAEATLSLNRSLHKEALAQYQVTKAAVEAVVAVAREKLGVAQARVAQAEAAVALREARLAQEIRRAQAERDEAHAWLTRLQKGTRREEVEAAQARLESAEALAVLCELEVRQSEQLAVEGIDSQYILATKKTRLTTQQKAVREAELELERLKAGPTAEEIEAGAQVLEAREAALALSHAASKDVDNLKAELGIRKAELRQAEAELKSAEAREVEKALAEERVNTAQAAVGTAEADLAARREDMVIRSTVAGTVIRTFDRVGETCRSGVTTIQVTDDAKGRWIAAYVREKDAFYVREGQPARVKLASGERVDAVVEAVGSATSSLDRQRGEPLDEAGQPSLPELVSVKLRPTEPIKSNPLPGMSARAVIRIR